MIFEKPNGEKLDFYEGEFCEDRECKNCQIRKLKGEKSCTIFIKENPHIAAEAVGYKFIDEGFINMDKNIWNNVDKKPEEEKEYLVCAIESDGYGKYTTFYFVCEYEKDRWDTDNIVVAWYDFKRLDKVNFCLEEK